MVSKSANSTVFARFLGYISYVGQTALITRKHPLHNLLEVPLIYMGFPKIRGTFLGVHIIRAIVYLGLYWGPLFWETTIYLYSYTHIYTVGVAGSTYSVYAWQFH